MSRGENAATENVVERLQAAHDRASALETEQALARLESALFGAPQRSPVLDRYPLLRELGRGASGVVYLAYDPKLDRKVAIKLLTGSGITAAESSEGRARLLREAQAMARSPHPNIVAVYDVGTYPVERAGESGVFMVMEYAEGPDLQTWLQTERSWREVLDVFVGAGHGLAAAHRVGVTHRDFKPVNAIVSEDGRVRVLDFGLARGLTRNHDEITDPGIGTPVGDSTLDAPLTVEGAVLGTPAYMAPEQHQGQAADPASDQFSFCVALWEGLHGVRPFRGRTLAELLEAKLAHAPRRASGRSVPGWLEEILLRGLEPERSRRWPSMDALLDAFSRGSSRQRLRGRAVIVAGIVAPLSVGGWWLGRENDALCTGAGEELASLWSPERRASLETAFTATGVPYAAKSYERVAEHVDRFTGAWSDQYRDACEATNRRGEQSAELMDLRMRGLERQKHEVDALLTVLADADPGVVEHAIQASSGLPSPVHCANIDALLAVVPPPSDPAVGEAVEALRRDLDRVKALEASGSIPAGLELAKGVADRAADLAYQPALAEALHQRGILEERSGRYDESASTLRQAHAAAIAVGHDQVAARVAELLVYVIGGRLGRLDAAVEWAEIAQAELRRARISDDRHRVLTGLGQAYRVAGNYEEAKRYTMEAIENLEQSVPADDPLVAMLHNNLGDILRELGEYDAARAELELALQIWTRSHGPDHPNVAMPLNNLGIVHLQRGEYEQAEAHYRRALEIRERALGTDHPIVATTLANLAAILRRTERYDEARLAFERAIEIIEGRFGEDDVRVGGMLQGLGLIAADQGRHADALAYVQQAVACWEKHMPADHPDLGRGYQNRAIRRLYVGDPEGARADLDRGLASYQKAFGKRDPEVANMRYLFAQALLDTGDAAEAAKLASLALDELEPGSHAQLQQAIESFLSELDERYPRQGEP